MFFVIYSYFSRTTKALNDIVNNFDENKRIKPRFSIRSWNLHDRVLARQPLTNNSVEAWHSALISDTNHTHL